MITPVILAGGSGTRLWPVSRNSYPKQFADLGNERTLFQETVLRLAGDGLQRPIVVTADDYRFIVTEQMGQIGMLPDTILIEPEGRDTAPAVLVAALLLEQSNQADTLMLVAPSDHAIPDKKAFQNALRAAMPAAQNGAIITFGIQPDRPETGYGYLELAQDNIVTDAPNPLKCFVEKPDAENATKMVASGKFLWNAGIFLFQANRIIAAFEQHAPQMIAPTRAALEQSEPDLGFRRLAADPWAKVEKISLDYAVMEKETGLMVMPFSAGWSDLGDWEAIKRSRPADANGIVTQGPTTAIDCSDSLLWAANEHQELVGIGLQNIIVIAMPDAVLVADRRHAQDVKQAVALLQQKTASQATQFTRDHRPWGWFDSLVTGPRFQVKRIVVTPGNKLSLQSHVHRAEHWTVVEGTAHVTLDGTEHIITENQSIFVPLGAVHRMENRGKLNMTLIEVQTGSYLGEDDIVRYEDIYSRDTPS